MCINKRKIYNLRYNPHDPLSSQFVEVNCNHCWQCKLERSNGFSFRVVNDVLQPGIVPFFVTLTYSPAFLPYLTVCTQKYPFKDFIRISTWNKMHVQNFHKRLRRSLEYYYGISSDCFKFLCCCERGSDRIYLSDSGRWRQAQELPHFHLMYLLKVGDNPTAIRKLPSDYYDYIRYRNCSDNFVSFFQYLLHKKWHYGNIDDVSYCRDVVSATSYITKYLTKNDKEIVHRLSLDSIFSYDDKDYYAHSDRFRKSGRPSKPVQYSNLCPRSFCSVN